jgi:signal transduction histidine kinase
MPEGGRITVETGNAAMDARAARRHDLPEGTSRAMPGPTVRRISSSMPATRRLTSVGRGSSVWRGQLTGGLAHDFNNLLAGISGSLELMQTRLQQGRLAAPCAAAM